MLSQEVARCGVRFDVCCAKDAGCIYTIDGRQERNGQAGAPGSRAPISLF